VFSPKNVLDGSLILAAKSLRLSFDADLDFFKSSISIDFLENLRLSRAQMPLLVYVS
jgi:hypothetical protein